MGCVYLPANVFVFMSQERMKAVIYLLMSHSSQHVVPSILVFFLLLSLLRKPSAGVKWMDQIFVLILLPIPQRAQQMKRDWTMARGWEMSPLQIVLHMSAVAKSEEW